MLLPLGSTVEKEEMEWVGVRTEQERFRHGHCVWRKSKHMSEGERGDRERGK